MKYNVALIGLGDIGLRYDYGLPFYSYTLSHYRAFKKHPNFEIIAAVEPDIERIYKGNHEFDFPIFSKLQSLSDIKNIDIFVIANPTDMHCKTGLEILENHSPRAIFCEKPLSHNFEEAKEFNRKCDEYGVNLFLNYFRRVDPALIYVKSLIKKNVLKPPFKCHAFYTKGLIHNGSHFIDLFYFFFGQITNFKTVEKFTSPDTSNDALLEVEYTFEFGSLNLKHAPRYDNLTPVFKCEFSNALIKYFDDGRIIIVEGEREQLLRGNKNHYQLDMVAELYRALDGQEHNICSGTQSLDTLHWITRSKEES